MEKVKEDIMNILNDYLQDNDGKLINVRAIG